MKSSLSEVKLISGTSNLKLSQDIADILNMELADISISKFADGEIAIKVNETVRGRDVFLIQPTSKPANENLMEALIIIDALKRASAHMINLIVPYYGYARQERKSSGREPITAKLVSDLIEKAGADRVVTVDLHASAIQGFFDVPLDHLTARPVIAEYLDKTIQDSGHEDWVVVSPDLGGVTRARKLADVLKLPIAIIEKSRPKPNESEILNVIGEFKGKSCIIIDDIIDTAGTITNAADTLVNKGAKEVYIAATHGVFSGPAVERIKKSKVKECIITDTIEQPSDLPEKIKVLSMAPLLSETIKSITNYTSVSDIMKERK